MNYQDRGAGQIRIPKTAELVAARIRKAIVTGGLKTGDNLPSEAQLIADFQVSRPTIREAIRVLESEGLISVSRGARGGAKVSQPTADMVARAAGLALQSQGATIGDVYEARMLIEAPAARLAAEHRPHEAAAALQVQLDHELSLVEDTYAVAQAIADFHSLLLDQSGNSALAVMGTGLRGVFENHLAIAQRSRPPITEASRQRQLRFGLKSHQRLIDLIRAGDGAGAEAHWISHMKAAGEVWLNNLGSTSVIDILD